MAWNEHSRSDPERYDIDNWNVDMRDDATPRMATATVTTSVGTAHSLGVTFKVSDSGRAKLHEVTGASDLSLDVLTTALAVAEAHVTDVAGVDRVHAIEDRVERVKDRIATVGAST